MTQRRSPLRENHSSFAKVGVGSSPHARPFAAARGGNDPEGRRVVLGNFAEAGSIDFP